MPYFPPEFDIDDYLPSNHLINWIQMRVSVGGEVVLGQNDGTQFFQTLFKQNNHALNDEVYCGLQLKKGTYRMTLNGRTGTDRGVQHVYVNGDAIGTIDWYQSVFTNNTEKSLDFITTKSGYHDIRFKVESKNAASTSYQIQIAYMHVRRI